MKCTLRQVAEGIVATVAEKKRFGFAPYLNLQTMEISNRSFPSLGLPSHYVQIIASTFGVGKELYVTSILATDFNGIEVPVDYKEYIEYVNVGINQEYPYTETETQIIINL